MEKNELKISLVQANTSGKSISANLCMLEEMIESIDFHTDIILLPELFNTGYKNSFSTKPEKMGLETHRWMKLIAERKGAAICGSISILGKEKTFNRMLFVEPSGRTQHYDKINVFKFSGEDKMFSAGESKPIFEFHGWRIKPIICFDLRFSESIRNQAPFYDLILCAAHWPDQRIAAWKKLLPARAIENQSYVAAVNRYGYEEDTYYPGHSVGLDFLGDVLVTANERAEIQSFEILRSALVQFRNNFPFLTA